MIRSNNNCKIPYPQLIFRSRYSQKTLGPFIVRWSKHRDFSRWMMLRVKAKVRRSREISHLRLGDSLPPTGSSPPSMKIFSGSVHSWPALSTPQTFGTFCCFLMANSTFPIATVVVAISNTNASPLTPGAAKQIGLVPRVFCKKPVHKYSLDPSSRALTVQLNQTIHVPFELALAHKMG